MTVTLERVFLIYLPTHARAITSTKLAGALIAVQWTMWLAVELHTFWTIGRKYKVLEDGTKVLIAGCAIKTSK